MKFFFPHFFFSYSKASTREMDLEQQHTKRAYFNAEITNTGTTNIPAKYDTVLLKPLIAEKSSEWDLCINRFRLPLNGINLSNKNIPFQKWQVALGYNTASSGSPAVWRYESAFVPQYNPKYLTNANNYFVLTSTSPSSMMYNVKTTDITNINSSYTINSTPTCYDSVDSGSIYAIAGTNQVNVYSLQDGTLSTTISLFGMIGTTFAIAVNAENRTLYALVSDSTQGNLNIQKYLCSNNTWTYMSASTIGSLNNSPEYSFGFSNGYIYFLDMSQPFQQSNYTIKYYNGLDCSYVGDLNVGQLAWNLVCVNQYVCVAANETGQLLVYKSNSANGSLSLVRSIPYDNGSSIGRRTTATAVGQDNAGNLLFYSLYDFIIKAINLIDGSVAYTTTTFGSESQPTYPMLVFPSPLTTSTAIDSGNYPLTTYQDYLNQINLALQQAFIAMQTAYPAYQPTEAPRVIYDASSKLFSVIVQGQYLQSNTYLLDFDTELYNMFLFPSVPDTNYPLFRSILVQDNITNAVGTTNPPTYVMVAQEASTIAKFYDLVRIIVQTSQIPVSGDSEGTNNSILLITDVVPDTSTLAPSSLLIYNPTVLRWYNLYGTTPLTKIDLSFSYGTKDGSVYPVYIAPNEYASCKLEFKKGFGDV
jgi:hypothetical protein